MVLRVAPCLTAAAVAGVMMLVVAAPQIASAQTPPAAAATGTADNPAAATGTAEGFAEETTLTAKTIVYIKGSGVWDSAFATLNGSFKKLKAYVEHIGKERARKGGEWRAFYEAARRLRL